MAPRNNDSSTSYKKKNDFPVEEKDIDAKDIVPSLLHKKHKVVKLVKDQMQKIQEEGLLCTTTRSELMEAEVIREPIGAQQRAAYRAEAWDGNGMGMERKSASLFWFLPLFLLTAFLLIYLMVWISAGPLSNSIAHTPIPMGSFVRTEGLCSLEKKYLLRWSKPKHFE